MSALFNAVLAKVAVFVCSFLLVTSGSTGKKTSRPRLPFRMVTAAQDKDTTRTTETKKPAQPSQEEEQAKKKAKEKKKSVKISISDEGVKVGSRDGEEKVILEFDPDEFGRALEDVEFQQQELLEDMEYHLELLQDLDLPESIAVQLLEDDDRAYVKIRGRDVVRFGEDIHVGKRELVQGDVVAIGGDIVIEGKVRGNVVNVFGDTELHGTAVINGDVVTVLGELSEYNNPRIRGETVNVAAGVPNISLPFFTYGTCGAGNIWDVITRIIKFIIFTLLLMLIIYFLPGRMRISSDHVFGSFFKSLGVGILVWIGLGVVIVLGFILAITIIGIPVALLLFLSYLALLLLGYFVSALALGMLLCRKFGPNGASPYLCGFMGLFLLTLPGFIAAMMWVVPFLAPIKFLLKTIAVFVGFLGITIGSGALIISKAGALSLEQRPDLSDLPDDPGAPDVSGGTEWAGPDEE
jgi:hypothetical protein